MSFPQELMIKKQWVCWRYEPDPNGGKPKKMPKMSLNVLLTFI